MKGKLLNYVESFTWNDTEKNRSVALQNYNNAINTARKAGDQVFCPEIMYNPENTSIIFQFMMFNGYQPYDQLKTHFEWLTVEDFQILLNLPNVLGKPTPNSSNGWDAFSEEFPEENKSFIGLEEETCPNPLVYDEATHQKFHSNYVSVFEFDKQKSQFEYFKRHYRPSLKFGSAQIATQITRKQVNEGIVRLDSPRTTPDGAPLHGQQIHAHIKIGKNEYALNIDGTWKHPPSSISTDRIPVEICLTLSQWGFCLPDEYY